VSIARRTDSPLRQPRTYGRAVFSVAISTGTLYLAGEHGTLLRSTDDGATWQNIPAAYEGSFYGILPLDKRTLIAHGLRGRSFRSIDDGDTWVPLVTPEPVLLAASVQLKSNVVILAGHARVLLVSRDNGIGVISPMSSH
jgi:photosystem II stability/assembly factor-like uncharacterized protein